MEVLLRVEREPFDYANRTEPVYHVGTDEKPSLCDKADAGKLSKGYGDPKDENLCKDCARLATLPATSLVNQVRRLEDVIEALRADIQSLYAHGPVNRAIGKIFQATSDLMDEAKERALKEVSELPSRPRKLRAKGAA